MQHHNNSSSFDRSANALDSRRRNSDLDYFFDFPQVSIDSSESLLSSFEMEGLPDPLIQSASRNSNSNSPHSRERINVIQNVLAKGLEDAKINALEELSSLLTSDKSILSSIDHTILHLLSSNLTSDVRSCLLSAKCLGTLAESSSGIRDHLFEFGTFKTLHELTDTLLSEDATVIRTVCSSFLRSEIVPSLSITKKVLFDLERHIKSRCIEPNPRHHESIPSILVSLHTLSYFSTDPHPEVAKILCTFTAFIASLLEHHDEQVLKAARVALKFMMPLQDTCIETPHKGYDIELPSPENHLMPPLLWRSTSSCEISPDSPMKHPNKDWIVSPIITTSVQNASANSLWEGDILICQNIEIFKADNSHVSTEEHVFSGQVGLRCIHCKSSPFKKMPFFTVFPSESSMLAPNLRHIARDHLVKCLSISPMVRQRLSNFLQQDKQKKLSYASVLESFCASFCSKHGIVDRYPIGSGLCLTEEQMTEKTKPFPPNETRSPYSNEHNSYEEIWGRSPIDSNRFHAYSNSYKTKNSTKNISNKRTSKLQSKKITKTKTASESRKDLGNDTNNRFGSTAEKVVTDDMLRIQNAHAGKSTVEILIGNDREMITDHLALSLEQMQICYFDNSSIQKINRDFEDGFPGLECIHCKGQGSHRQFFWSSAYRFVNSSTEFSKHLMYCEYCPDDIKNQLVTTKDSHRSQIKSLPVGSLTAFFHRLYRRLFGDIEVIQSASIEHVQNCDESHQLLDLHTASSSSEVRQSSIMLSQSDNPNKIVLHIAADDKWLPEHEILLRKSIEVFTATTKDKKTIETKWVGLRLSVDQVCFRCIYCSQYNAYLDRSSFFFSTGIEKIRPDAYRFQHHLGHCPHAPDAVTKCFSTPIPYSHAKEKSNMWKQSAESLGLFSCQNRAGRNIIKTHSLGEPRFKNVATSPISKGDILDDSLDLSNVSMETSESEVSIDRQKRSFDDEVNSPAPKVQKVSLSD